ncbi:MAG: dUTP diphosphatase [Holosporales bacterium]|jgi:dUTP pyrophosphatase|nr:dUTP diphosphatase [Holosporales bacterium]
MITIPLKILPHGEGLPYPFYATPQSAGMDVFAAIDAPETLPPRERIVVKLGFCIALPDGIEAQIRSRSGLAAKHGVCVLNAPGTIDPDYRGELGAILINLGQDPFVIERGMRIAQIVFAEFVRCSMQISEDLSSTERGDSGFGSTGIKT